MKAQVILERLASRDQEAFILANQEAFNYGALEEFGQRHTYFEEEGQVIARDTVLMSLEQGQAYWIVQEGRRVGGLVLLLDGRRGELETLFISPKEHSKGLGQAAWQAVEETFSDIAVWETITPYYDQRNIHFYVNRCGFQIVEYFNAHHRELGAEREDEELLEQFPAGVFRFEKIMSK